MSWLLPALVAALLGPLVAELLDWVHPLARRVLRRAIRRLPPEYRDEYEAEWLAEIEAMPGRHISHLMWAISVWAAASNTGRALTGAAPRPTPRLGRALDLSVALFGFVFFLPVFALICAALRLESPGPAFFRSVRVGLGGRVFSMLKFRSMRIGGDGDRLTHSGRFLRISNFEQFPQLVNIIRGEMSLVGPRPTFPHEVEQYPDWYYARFAVKPGMTGLSQVSGCDNYEDMIRLDIEYVQKRSFLYDLKILGRTVKGFLSR